MVSFEIFVKAMPPSLSELKVLPSFCFTFKIPDDVAVTIIYYILRVILRRYPENIWCPFNTVIVRTLAILFA